MLKTKLPSRTGIILKAMVCLATLSLSSFSFAQSGPTLVSGDLHNCVLDYSRVQCWGDDSLGQATVPELDNPKAISAGRYHTCAVNNESVKCWGQNDEGQAHPPQIENVKNIAAGFKHTCALTDKDVRCWGNNNFKQLDVPPLKKPKSIFAGDHHTCAIDDNGLKCWGDIEVPNLQSLRYFSSRNSYSCAINNKGVKCWGHNGYSQSTVPPLKNPIAISSGAFHSCAIDETEVKCWGGGADEMNKAKIILGPSLKSPSFRMEQLSSSLDILISASSPARAMFFKNLQLFIKSHLQSTTDSVTEKFYTQTSQYILLSLLGPSLLTGDSEYYVQKIHPSYERDLKIFSKELGTNDLNGIQIAPPLTRKTVVATIQASLSVATEFLPIQQKQQIAETTKLLGIAMSNPDRGSILAALDSIQRNQSILDSLKSSSKTAFLPATIETAAAWLDKKVR